MVGQFGEQFEFGCPPPNRVGPDRRGAGCLDTGKDGPLGGHGEPRGLVVQACQSGFKSADPAFDRQGPLGGGGYANVGVEQFSDRVAASQALQAGRGEHDGVHLSVVHLAQPGVNISSDGHDLQVRPDAPQSGGPSGTGGADPCPLRQPRQRQSVARAKRISGVGARRDRRHHQPRQRCAWQILE